MMNKPTKRRTCLIDDHYNTPSTSLLTFHFEPAYLASTAERLKHTQIQHASIEGKDVYTFDRFFLPLEEQEMRVFGEQSTFSRNSYGSPEAITQGEKPAQSMNSKERWQFFSHPPLAVHELYQLLSLMAYELNAEISTLPWELCDRNGHGSSSVVVNLIKDSSYESMELGKHQDCNPQKGISFGIPLLYAPGQLHAANFNNGSVGKPWLVSVMLYTTEEEFLPEYQMGTVFYTEGGSLVLRTHCHHMRLVLFEGDIVHSIEESKIPLGVETWRISHVFKLILNPRHEALSMKQAFLAWVHSLTSPPTSLSVGIKS
jgi:hypothetical protein